MNDDVLETRTGIRALGNNEIAAVAAGSDLSTLMWIFDVAYNIDVADLRGYMRIWTREYWELTLPHNAFNE